MSDLDVIKEIEKIIGKELKLYPVPININYWNVDYGYLINHDVLQVTTLNLIDCNLESIDFLKALKNITRLDLSNNKIKNLPEWILDFNLKIFLKEKSEYSKYDVGIYLDGNPLEEPPIEIINKGNKAIRAYFEQLRKKGTDYIYEAKLILVGEGGAGKTSLANKIINSAWQLIPENESQSTQGIDILKYEFPYKDKTFRVNIWDFGGQEIYHQTHQFFLSKRSVYVLVADSRKEDTDFYYWLNTVDLLTNNSPILIVKNEKQNRARKIPEIQLKSEFGNIKDIFAANLKNNRGLNVIIENLQHYLSQLPHIGSSLPKTWVKVREQLEHDDRYYLDLKEYFAICQANGFESEADKRLLSGYLHD